MKIKYFLLALLLSVFSLTAGAAGSPMNENFANLIALSNTAIDVGNTGDAAAFVDSVKAVLTAIGEQNDKGSSIRLQRADARMKKALRVGKAGNLSEGIAAMKSAIVQMEAVRN